jgi:uncharacterized protein YkwD
LDLTEDQKKAAIEEILKLTNEARAEESKKRTELKKDPKKQKEELAIENKLREQHGQKPLTPEDYGKPLPPLKLNSKLSDAAQAHTDKMVAAGELTHQLNGEKQLGDRVKDAGYIWKAVGENIAQNNAPLKDSPKVAFDGWMASPKGHREAILNHDFEEIGIGVKCAANGDIYYTQVFATPMARGAANPGNQGMNRPNPGMNAPNPGNPAKPGIKFTITNTTRINVSLFQGRGVIGEVVSPAVSKEKATKEITLKEAAKISVRSGPQALGEFTPEDGEHYEIKYDQVTRKYSVEKK